MKANYRNLLIFVLIALAIFALYNGFQHNYYFSDDYQWISHAILVDDSLSEIFLVRGRDFNPLLTTLFWIIVKIGGLSPLLFRLLCFFTFTSALFLFYYHLTRYFKVNPLAALYAALLCGFNVYISEVMLYLSTFVYALTLLLFFIAFKFFLDGRKILYLLFMLLAFQVKETIILAVIPLFLYEKQRNNRILLVVSTPLIFLTRFIFQAGSTGSYTHFAAAKNIFYKLYFLILHPMNLSPFAMTLSLGIGVILILLIIFTYYLIASGHEGSPTSEEKKIKKKFFGGSRGPHMRGGAFSRFAAACKNFSLHCALDAVRFAFFSPGRRRQEKVNLNIDRRVLFFGSFFAVYVLFFSFLPKLSSKYYFYPCFAFWGCAALLGNYFLKRSKHTKYFMFSLLLISLLFNFPAVKKEIEDYKIMGDFSKSFIEEQGRIIKNKLNIDKTALELRIERVGDWQLRRVYQKIYDRGNLLKLLPIRKHSLGGVLTPVNLIPIIFYPGKIVHWRLIKETPGYFSGKCVPKVKQ